MKSRGDIILNKMEQELDWEGDRWKSELGWHLGRNILDEGNEQFMKRFSSVRMFEELKDIMEMERCEWKMVEISSENRQGEVRWHFAEPDSKGGFCSE